MEQKKIKVLVVDDDHHQRKISLKILANKGYETAFAVDGKSAVEEFETFKPHIVLLDVILPDTTGFELCKQMKESKFDHQVFVIMISGKQKSEESRIKGLNSGADAYLQKPVSMHELAAWVMVFARLRKSEEALQRSEDRYKRIVDDSLQGLVIAQTNPTRLSFVSKPMTAITGFSVEEMLDFGPEELQNLIHPEDRSRFFASFQKRLMGENIDPRAEYRLINKSGDVRWVEIFSSLTTINGEAATQTVFIDITDKQKVKIELQHKQNLLTQTQSIAKVGSWELVHNENLLSWSDEVYRIFGLLPNEFTPDYELFLEYVHPEDRKKVNNTFQKSLKFKEDTYEIEHRVLRDDGEIKYVQEKCIHEKNIKGEIIRSIGMVQDITEHKEVEMKLINYKTELEKTVKERTKELEDINQELFKKNDELERYNNLFIGREFRIKELREKVKALEAQINSESQ